MRVIPPAGRPSSASRLDYVSEVGFQTEDSVVRVSFEGGTTEQEEIERAIREVGYDIFKVSHTER